MRSLDPEQIGLLLNDTWLAWRAKLDGRLRPLGLSQGKWRTLVHLAQGGDQLSQSELASRMGIEEPTLVGLLRRLERDGWIKRRDASHDRRCKNVRLARKTSPVLREIFDTARQLRHQLLADISARDLQTCMRVLARIHEKAETKDMRNGSGGGMSNKKR
jgi:MarR family transcriptional regulator for hemolysin